MDWLKDPIGSIGDAIGIGGGGGIGGAIGDILPIDELVKQITDVILSPFKSIINDIKEFFQKIWKLLLSVFGFAYMGLLLAGAAYAITFIILL